MQESSKCYQTKKQIEPFSQSPLDLVQVTYLRFIIFDQFRHTCNFTLPFTNKFWTGNHFCLHVRDL